MTTTKESDALCLMSIKYVQGKIEFKEVVFPIIRESDARIKLEFYNIQIKHLLKPQNTLYGVRIWFRPNDRPFAHEALLGEFESLLTKQAEQANLAMETWTIWKEEHPNGS